MEASLQSKLTSYKPAASTIQIINSTPLLFLVGPTGAGKDSVKQRLLQTGKYHHIVSHTTRPPRINHGILEIDGEDYHFINMEQAEQMIDAQSFVEAKMFSGNLYATSAKEIEAAKAENKVALTDIEVQGVAEYKSLDPSAMAIFLLPPSFKIWQERLERRYGDVVDAEDYTRRLQTALTEIDQLVNNEYYVAVINDDIEQTAQTIDQVVNNDAHANPDEAAAREVAGELERDIKAYLEKNG
jgi:guanylate kinase